MAKCDVCGKDISFGIKVSHSHRRSNRTWKPNIKRVKAVVNGTPKRIYACTRDVYKRQVDTLLPASMSKAANSFARVSAGSMISEI